MRTRMALGALLGLSLLAGCGGGGSGPSVPVQRDGPTTTGIYNITDLGAATYYYGEYYYSPNFGLYRPVATIALNNNSQIVSSEAGQAGIYQNGTLTDLSSSYSVANGLNDVPQVVGGAPASTSNYSYHATLWQNGTQVDLGTLGAIPAAINSDYSQAYGINAVGQAVGESQVSDNNYNWHAFLWQNGQMSDLGTLGGDNSRAFAINRSGTVVGWSSLATSGDPWSAPVHGFVWQNGKISDLGTLPGGTNSDVSAINDSGWIVGSSSVPPQGLFRAPALRAVLWNNSAIHDLGTLGGPSSIAYGINNTGQIVGSANTTIVDNDPIPYYFIYGGYANSGGGGGGVAAGGGNSSGGSPAPSPGNHPGNANPIGGGAITRAVAHRPTRGIGDDYVSHAFLWSNGTMTDLNTLIDNNSGWELVEATAINNNGQIVGYGVLNKRVHGFLLTPR